MSVNYELVARSHAFDHLITNTIFTDAKGDKDHIETGYARVGALLHKTCEAERNIYIIGNGGSAAVASHILTDFVNVCRLPAFTLHDSALITCMSNDFGYENSFMRALNTVFKKGDVLIAISSSGKSANICNAAKAATALGGAVVTFTGFHSDNALRKLGTLNFWLNSNDYGFVEVGHLFLLHNLADRIAQAVKEREEIIKTGS